MDNDEINLWIRGICVVLAIVVCLRTKTNDRLIALEKQVAKLERDLKHLAEWNVKNLEAKQDEHERLINHHYKTRIENLERQVANLVGLS